MPIPEIESTEEWDMIRRVRVGTSEFRWFLASEPDLPESLYWALLASQDDEAVSVLAGNSDAPRALLETIARCDPLNGLTARHNPRVSPEVKNPTRIGDHSYESIDQYLIDMDATEEQWAALRHLYEHSPHPGGVLLEEAWESIAGPSDTRP